MTKEKKINYKKAHVELYEIIRHLTDGEKGRIPKAFVDSLKNNIDDNYTFQFDETKTIFEQNLMIETKALLIQMYKKYLAPKNEKELWNSYNRICLDRIDKNKKEKYNPDNLFKKVNVNINYTNENLQEKHYNQLSLEIRRQNIFQKILIFIKRLVKH